MTSIKSLSDKHTINTASDNEALQTDHYMFNNVYIDAALNFSGRLLHEGFVQCCSIKKVKLFPKGPIRKSVQIFIYTTVLGWIILFFYLSFIQNQNAVYISLSNNSGNCENVSKPLTGTFLVSTDGIWESSRGFLYSKAIYNYQFVDLLVTNDQFQTLILNQFSLTNIIKIMNKSDIGTNLLIWMQYKKQISINNKLQSFHFPSSPPTLCIIINTLIHHSYLTLSFSYIHNMIIVVCIIKIKFNIITFIIIIIIIVISIFIIIRTTISISIVIIIFIIIIIRTFFD